MSAAAAHEANWSYRDVLRNRRAAGLLLGDRLARWAGGEQAVQFLVGRNRPEGFEADDLARCTGGGSDRPGGAAG